MFPILKSNYWIGFSIQFRHEGKFHVDKILIWKKSINISDWTYIDIKGGKTAWLRDYIHSCIIKYMILFLWITLLYM